jgi:hypothetical protein
MTTVIDTFGSKSLGMQVTILALILDPVAIAAGYLLHPYLGVTPIFGVAYGVAAVAVLLMVWTLTGFIRSGSPGGTL